MVSNDNVATFIKEFVVRLPEGETLDFESGGYIQIGPPYEATTAVLKALRIALSRLGPLQSVGFQGS